MKKTSDPDDVARLLGATRHVTLGKKPSGPIETLGLRGKIEMNKIDTLNGLVNVVEAGFPDMIFVCAPTRKQENAEDLFVDLKIESYALISALPKDLSTRIREFLTQKTEVRKHEELWGRLDLDFISGRCIDGIVEGRVHGGFAVRVGGCDGIQAFVAVSCEACDRELVKYLQLAGEKTLQFKIVKLNKKRGNLVLRIADESSLNESRVAPDKKD